MMTVDIYERASIIEQKLTASTSGLYTTGDLDFKKGIDAITKAVNTLAKEARAASKYLDKINYKSKIDDVQREQEKEAREKSLIVKPEVAMEMKDCFLEEMRLEKYEPNKLTDLHNIRTKISNLIKDNNITQAQYNKIKEDAEREFAKNEATKEKERVENFIKNAEKTIEPDVKTTIKEPKQANPPAKETHIPKPETPKKETTSIEVGTPNNGTVQQTAEADVALIDPNVKRVAYDLAEIAKGSISKEEILKLAETIVEYEKPGNKNTGIVFEAFYARQNGQWMSPEVKDLYYRHSEMTAESGGM